MENIVAQVEEKERDEIQNIFEKKGALENLVKIVNPQENYSMYQQVVQDYAEVMKNFQNWWDKMQIKYQWKAGNYYINFDTCDICEVVE